MFDRLKERSPDLWGVSVPFVGGGGVTFKVMERPLWEDYFPLGNPMLVGGSLWEGTKQESGCYLFLEIHTGLRGHLANHVARLNATIIWLPVLRAASPAYSAIVFVQISSIEEPESKQLQAATLGLFFSWSSRFCGCVRRNQQEPPIWWGYHSRQLAQAKQNICSDCSRPLSCKGSEQVVAALLDSHPSQLHAQFNRETIRHTPYTPM